MADSIAPAPVPSTIETTTTTTTRTTTTTTTTTTPVATTTPETTTVPATTTVDQTSTESTVISDGRTTWSSIEDKSPHPDVVIAVITVSALVCVIIIIAVCYLMYRKGEKKRKLEKSVVSDAKFTPKNTRTRDSSGEAGPRLSTIEETGQSCDGAANNRESSHSRNSQAIRNSQLHQSEPQYENLAVAKDQTETYYIEPNAKEELQVKTDGERNTDSFYENFSDPKYGNMNALNSGDGLYQNTQNAVEDGESFYEDPLQNENLDIYVDMA